MGACTPDFIPTKLNDGPWVVSEINNASLRRDSCWYDLNPVIEGISSSWDDYKLWDKMYKYDIGDTINFVVIGKAKK